MSKQTNHPMMVAVGQRLKTERIKAGISYMRLKQAGMPLQRIRAVEDGACLSMYSYCVYAEAIGATIGLRFQLPA